MQLKVEKVKYGLIPCYVVYPIRETGKTVIFLSWLEQQGRIAGQSGGVPGRSWVYSFYS